MATIHRRDTATGDLHRRQKAVWAAFDAATDHLRVLSRGTAERLEWAFIREACSRESRRLSRQLQRVQAGRSQP